MKLKWCASCKRELEIERFHKNKDKYDGLSTYCKECRRAYRQRPEVQKSRKEYREGYYEKPGVKDRLKKYYENPEVKKRERAYAKEYSQRPEIKARAKKYNARPEVKARQKEYSQRPEVKQRTKEYYQKPEVKVKRREQNKQWKKNNPEKAKQNNRYNPHYYKNNKEKRLRWTKEWKLRNPERAKEMHKKAMEKFKTEKPERYTELKRRSNRNRRARKNNIIDKFTDAEWQKKLEKTNGICPGCKTNVGIDKLQQDHIYPIFKADKDYKQTGIMRRYYIDDIQPLCKSCNVSKGDKVVT